MSHEKHQHSELHVALKVAKLVLKAMTLAATICAVKQIHRVGHELHKVHKALEQDKK